MKDLQLRLRIDLKFLGLKILKTGINHDWDLHIQG